MHRFALAVNSGLVTLGIKGRSGKSVQDLTEGQFPLGNHLQKLPEELQDDIIASKDNPPVCSPNLTELEAKHDELELNGTLSPEFSNRIVN